MAGMRTKFHVIQVKLIMSYGASLCSVLVMIMVTMMMMDRFTTNLRYLELPCDLITREVLQELANRCPNLTHLLLDFSHGAQLADFTELNAFPTKIK